MIGALHSIVARLCGRPQRLSKPGDVVTRIADGHVHMCSFAYQTPILCFGVACHVRRPFPSFHMPSTETRRLVSWFRLCTFGSFQLVSWKIPPTQFFATCRRYAPKNHSLSCMIGPPKAGLKSPFTLTAFGVRKPRACEIVGEVAARHRLVREGAEDGPVEAVAALLRNDAHAQAAFRHFGRDARRINRHFLSAAHVGDVGRVLRHGRQHRREAADEHLLIDAPAPVDAHPGVGVAGGAPDVLAADAVERQTRLHGDAGEQHGVLLDVPARGNGVDDVMAERRCARRALDVDDRRLAGDGQRFLDGAHPQLRVDRGGKRRRSARCLRA